jgi:hypothetical protein
MLIKNDTTIRVICEEYFYKNWNINNLIINSHFSKINLRSKDMRKIDKKSRRIRQYSNIHHPESCADGLYLRKE